MKLTKYGHAAFLIEDGKARILLDPGAFSSGFEELADLSAVLYTHEHFDHYDEAKLKLVLANNPDVKLVADVATAKKLMAAGHEAKTVDGGDEFEIDGVAIKVIGHDHAVIHPDFPTAKNVGYLIGGRLFYPGDALTVPTEPVEILLLPVESPWSKLSEGLDYLKAVHPKVALPAHELILAMPHLWYGWVEQIAQSSGIDWRPMQAGETIEL